MLFQRRRTPTPAGTKSQSKLSFFSLPDHNIVGRAERLGDVVGNTLEQKLASVSTVKEIEKSRSITYLKNNMHPMEEGDENSLVVRRATNLSEDLIDDDENKAGDHTDLLIRDMFKTTRGRKKKTGHHQDSKLGEVLGLNYLIKIKMKGMIWNSDGFGDIGKHLTVHETVKEQKLDFCGPFRDG